MLADDIAEFKEHDCLVMLFAVHKCVQKIFNFAVGTGLANYIAESGEHD